MSLICPYLAAQCPKGGTRPFAVVSTDDDTAQATAARRGDHPGWSRRVVEGGGHAVGEGSAHADTGHHQRRDPWWGHAEARAAAVVRLRRRATAGDGDGTHSPGFATGRSSCTGHL